MARPRPVQILAQEYLILRRWTRNGDILNFLANLESVECNVLDFECRLEVEDGVDCVMDSGWVEHRLMRCEGVNGCNDDANPRSWIAPQLRS
jgi:hypothetical protein